MACREKRISLRNKVSLRVQQNLELLACRRERPKGGRVFAMFDGQEVVFHRAGVGVDEDKHGS